MGSSLELSGISTAMSSFFTLPASQRKRKREDRVGAPVAKKRGVTGKGAPQSGDKSRRQAERDESISGSDSEGDERSEVSAGSEDESLSGSEGDETAAERRLRLAEQYLHNVREEVDEVGFDAAEIDRDLIAERLKEDVVSCAFSQPCKPLLWPQFRLIDRLGRIQRPSI